VRERRRRRGEEKEGEEEGSGVQRAPPHDGDQRSGAPGS
jgi:hypothetical protein